MKAYRKLLLVVTSVIVLSLITVTAVFASTDISSLTAIPTSTTITLRWQQATGFSNTVIRYSTTTYPNTPSDGVLVYSGTGTYYIQTGLVGGTAYYYTAWGYDGGSSYTPDVSADKILMNTLAGIPTTDILTTPVQPPNKEPSSAGWFDGLQPFSGFVQGFEISWGMKTDTMPFTIGIIILLVVGFGLYIKTKSPLVAIAGDFVVDFGLVAMGILAPWSVGVVIAFGLGVWALENIWI